MDDFLFTLVALGFPVVGTTIVLVYYIIYRYKERHFMMEKGIEIPKSAQFFHLSRVAIMRIGLISIGLSLGMYTGVILMEHVSNPVVSEDEGIAWGITIPLFTGLSLLASYFIGKDK